MSHQPQFPKQRYRFTVQLEPEKIPNCIRSLTEAGCIDVHQVGLRIRYITNHPEEQREDCLHFLAVAMLRGQIMLKAVRFTYVEAVEALIEYVTHDQPVACPTTIRRLFEVQDQFGNHVYEVEPKYARADRVMVMWCRCYTPLISHSGGDSPEEVGCEPVINHDNGEVGYL